MLILALRMSAVYTCPARFQRDFAVLCVEPTWNVRVLLPDMEIAVSSAQPLIAPQVTLAPVLGVVLLAEQLAAVDAEVILGFLFKRTEDIPRRVGHHALADQPAGIGQ